METVVAAIIALTAYGLYKRAQKGNANASNAVSPASSEGGIHLQIINLTDRSRGIQFYVGDQWQLSVTGAAPNASLDIYVSGGIGGWTQGFGRTDNNGRWTKSGTFNDSMPGHWTEKVRVGGLESNTIQFGVSVSPTPATTVVSDVSPSGNASRASQPTAPDGSTYNVQNSNVYRVYALNNGVEFVNISYGSVNAQNQLLSNNTYHGTAPAGMTGPFRNTRVTMLTASGEQDVSSQFVLNPILDAPAGGPISPFTGPDTTIA